MNGKGSMVLLSQGLGGISRKWTNLMPVPIHGILIHESLSQFVDRKRLLSNQLSGGIIEGHWAFSYSGHPPIPHFNIIHPLQNSACSLGYSYTVAHGTGETNIVNHTRKYMRKDVLFQHSSIGAKSPGSQNPG